MEGNDLGTLQGQRHVIILEGVLMIPPVERTTGWRTIFTGRSIGKNAAFIDEWAFNEQMIAWMQWMGYTHSYLTEVWSFLPAAWFEPLVERLVNVAGDYILECKRWDRVADASRALRISRDIETVYDVDVDRLELWWQGRGSRPPT